MTDRKDIKNKISSVIDSIKDLDTIDLKGQIDDKNQLFDYSSLLANISDDPEMAVGAEIGHWQIKKLIDSGGMSIVYLVERNDDQLKQQAALKIIPNGLANKSMIDRFVRERQILSDLHHPNIAQLYDAGVTDQGLPWFVMEYIQGEDIITYAKNNQLNIDQRIYLIKQVCNALAYAHAHNVVHRDIKPNNLMVDHDKNIKLLDFGIASSKEQQSLTMTGAIIGTPGYMSPEQAKGLSSEIDTRSDIFSLGVLLYKLIKHDMPFQAESISEISYKIIHNEPILLGSQIPIELQAITFKCLEKKVENRYSSIKHLQKDLDAYLNGDVVSARKVNFIGRFLKKIKKHPVYSTFIFAAFISTILGISYGIYQSFESIRKLQVSEKYLAKTQELKAKIRRSHMMPLHDIESDYLVVEKEIKKLREEIENSDIDHSGLSYFALGEAYFNMKGFTKALEYFQKAEKKGWQSNELYSGLGFTLLARWTKEKKKANAIVDKDEKKIFLDKLKAESFTPAIAYLKKAKEGASDVNFLAARLAYVEKDYDKALEYADKEISINPWHYEALRLASEIYLFKFKSVGRKKGYDVATKYLDLSNEKLEQSINIGRSDPYNYTSRCTNSSIDVQIQMMLKLEEPLLKAFDKGVEYCRGALKLKPHAHSPWSSLNILYTTKARLLESQNKPTNELYLQALAITNEGLQVNPQDFYLLSYKIKPLIKLADFAIDQGEDPNDYYQQAMQSANLAIAINPDHANIWTELAKLHNKQADNLLVLQQNYSEAEKHYFQAIESFKKNRSIDPSIDSLLNIAEVEYSLHNLNLLQNLPMQAIKYLEQSVEHRLSALPLRIVYFDQILRVLELQIDLIELKQSNIQSVDEEINNAQLYIKSLCDLSEITTENKIKINQLSSIYIEKKWLTNQQINQCLLNK
jgi:serine/threonine-protein kinase